MPISERPQPHAAEMMIESPDKAAVEGHAFSHMSKEETEKKHRKYVALLEIVRPFSSAQQKLEILKDSESTQ